MRDLPVGGGEGDQVHPVELVGDVAPGVAGGVLGDPDEQQREPAQLDVGTDAVLALMEDRPQFEGAFHVAPAAFYGEELLVRGSQILRCQGGIGGA